MKRLKLTLLFNDLKNNYIIVVIFFIINLLIYKGHFILIIFDLGYVIYLFIKNKRLLIYIIILLLMLFSNLFIRNMLFNNSYKENIEEVLKVENIIKTDNNYKVYFKVNNALVLSYTKEELNIGSYYYIKGKVELASTSHYKNGFNYYNYLKNKNIVGILKIEKYSFVKKGFSKYILNNIVTNYLNKTLKTKSKGMIKALTIGEKEDLDDELFNSINKIGISHLFVISGLHINIISSGILFILRKLKFKENISNIITICILILYFIICGYLISVIRVILSFILKLINKTYKYDLHNIDIMSINIILVLLYNPMHAFTYSFILSYTISSSIIICHKILSSKGKFKNIKSSLKVSILSVLITLPIISMINPTLNLLSILYNIIYIPFITYIMLPLSFVTVIFPFIENLYLYIYLVFEYITNIVSQIKILNITFPCFNTYILISYYLLLYYILKYIELKKLPLKLIITFTLLLIYWNNINLFNIYNEVYFIDLPKGEATLIRENFNKTNILIDTGEDGYNDIILFLKSMGIKRLDMVIISHSDSDHNGMLDELIEEFNIKHIYYNQYDLKTKNIANHYKINNSPLKYNEVIKKNNILLKVISPKKDYQDTNKNSLVLYGNIFNTTYLFTGDITEEVENDIDIKKVDILKVAHHGSNTSTSSDFLNEINFNKNNKVSIAICMNGYKNTFSFPTKHTVSKFQVPLYITSNTKTLCIRKNKEKYQIIQI